MKINRRSTLGLSSPRFLSVVALCSCAVLLGTFSMLSRASDPPSDSATVPATPGQTITVTWSGTIPPGVNGTSDCAVLDGTPQVDQHLSTIHVPANLYNSINAKFTFNISWDNGDNDEILTVLNPDGSEIDSSDGGNPTETVTAKNLAEGEYKVLACGFSSTSPQSYTGKLTIETGAGGPPVPPPLPSPTPSFAGGPRYNNYAPPPAVGENSGEPSIGYNPATHRAMYLAGLQTLQVTFPQDVAPLGAFPEACDAIWKDVSYIVTKTKSLDPILFTDEGTGRTFVSQLDSVTQTQPAGVLVGLNSLMAFTDDDGATWTPAQVNPPDGSYDHQTVGAGPYPASVPLGNSVNKGHAVYYCAQAGRAAFCSRSDDGGLNFGRATATYTNQTTPVTTGCVGIHGHVKVAPDGTVYLPDFGCGGIQSVAVSTDAGTTWTVRQVKGPDGPDGKPTWFAKPPPGSAILDPSVGTASDGTVYFSYINGDGHPHVAVSKDQGQTWINDFDIGASQNIANGVFVEAVAGDPDRAAVGFVGTTQGGDHEAADFNGTWYPFIAHTYDGGKSWVTVNASPSDPVQKEACIWNEGGSNPCRNLLDFNEITMDENGRVLYGYADGCINDCAAGGPNSYSSKATIARQSGGKGLLASKDAAFFEPASPQRPCLSGRRDDMAAYLKWTTPDNGGSDITSYKILRSAPGVAEAQVGTQVGSKNSFTDRTADPAVAKYTYRIIAVNGTGQSAPSNSVDLTIGPRLEPTGSCSQPGVTIVTDPVGDETDTVPQHDITSVSIAEPISDANSGAAKNIVFTMKVVNLSTVPPGWRWSVRFTVQGVKPPADASGGPSDDFFVAMNSDGPTPSFTYGVTSVPQSAARVFTTLGTLDPGSNFKPDGTITMVLPKSAISADLKPGTGVAVELGSVRAYGLTGGTNETIPDTTGAGGYGLRQPSLCLPNTPPIARLTSDVESGEKPLTVQFDGSQSSDTDAIDTIGSYTFNFGDGGDDVVQSSPVISHTFTDPGEYAVRLVVTDARGKVSSNTAQRIIAVGVEAPSVQLLNLSGRVVVEGGDKVAIGGFIVRGSTAKKIIVRALGPSLKVNGQPVAGTLQDPVLELHDSLGNVLTNDNWRSTQAAEIQQTGLAPTDDRESAIVQQVPPGEYTAVVRSANNSGGIALVEIYDLEAQGSGSELGNLSVRAQVLNADNVLIGGIIIGSGEPKRVVLRAIGPDLHSRGVTGELLDPTLELHDGNGALMASNDNWRTASNAAELDATALAPRDDREAAILTTLGAGAYTGVVQGANGTTGIALAEAYKLP